MPSGNIMDIVVFNMTSFCLEKCRNKSESNPCCKRRRMRYKLDCPYYAIRLCEELNNAHYLKQQAESKKRSFTRATAAQMTEEELVERAKQVLKENGYSGTLQKTIEFTI